MFPRREQTLVPRAAQKTGGSGGIRPHKGISVTLADLENKANLLRATQ